MAGLRFAGFQQAEQVRNAWRATPEHGTMPDDMLDPSYWVYVAEKLTPFDRIEVVAQDRSFFGELLVLGGNKVSANVRWIQFIDLLSSQENPGQQGEKVEPKRVNTASEDSAPSYKIEWGGPQHKWRILRASDKAIMSKGHVDENSAKKWIRENPVGA